MRINRDNYELFLVNYTEGTLSADIIQEVEDYLMQNPDIKEEFDLFNSDILETSNAVFANKKNLKGIPYDKTTAPSEYFQQLCVDYIDGELPKNEQLFFKKLIATDVKKQKELTLFAKTKLTPDFSIVYPDKNRIKRFTILTPTFKKYFSVFSAVAAIIIFALMIFNTSTVNDKIQLAGHTSNNTDTEFIDNKLKKSEQTVINKVKKEKILHDPLGFKKINSNNNQITISKPIQTRIVIKPIVLIKIKKIECPSYNLILENKQLAINSVNKNFKASTLEKNMQNNTNEETVKSKVIAIAQTNFIRINNKLKNGRLKVKKNNAGDKTLIAFNSKYFSISTNVKSRN